VDVVGSVAEPFGASRAQISLAWLLAQPGVTAPIVGAAKPTHLAGAIAALSLRLDDESVRELEAHYVPHATSFLQEVPGRDRDR
jgi:aryl-alcohol dehydrogenase-like predicted oxidoreductase